MTEAAPARRQSPRKPQAKRKQQDSSHSEGSGSEQEDYGSESGPDGKDLYSRKGQYRKVQARDDQANHKYSTRTRQTGAKTNGTANGAKTNINRNDRESSIKAPKSQATQKAGKSKKEDESCTLKD